MGLVYAAGPGDRLGQPAQVVMALGFRILTCSISVPKNASNVCDIVRIDESESASRPELRL